MQILSDSNLLSKFPGLSEKEVLEKIAKNGTGVRGYSRTFKTSAFNHSATSPLGHFSDDFVKLAKLLTCPLIIPDVNGGRSRS